MKQKIALFSLLLALVCTTACKKNSSTTPSSAKTTQELLLGEWIIDHETLDDNDNGTLEESEIDIRNGDIHWIFEDNGHAAVVYDANSSSPSSTAYQYTLSGTDISWVGTNVVYHIEKISETELRFRYLDNGDLMWRMFHRK